MESFNKPVEIRWSDLDPNFHLRHSVYYDWGAYVRMMYMTENGITPSLLLKHHIGPILFREECSFKREIGFQDKVTLNLQLVKCTREMDRWSMRHEVWKNGDTLCAIIQVDGAWLDTQLRKLAIPPDMFKVSFENIPRAADFAWIEK